MATRPPTRLFGGPFSLAANLRPARAAAGRATVQMAKVLLPAAIKISGLANNRHAHALGRSAINFSLATNATRNKHANNLVNAMVNYYFSPGNFSPHTKQIALSALNKMRTYAPGHYNALKWSVVRKAPRILYKSVVR
jgi:hypothetical protein